ncbi:hypothetical protein D9757_007162 [Collybiopsis confluens]|uniref:FIST domain-containing protein n=1 Tax=Collybiopsis confluens TaxID=2823264 RepID=A0A8H5HCF1_9AGAR|nr:hypothetical protein D9757_007162 [Collybiopsis confluens]
MHLTSVISRSPSAILARLKQINAHNAGTVLFVLSSPNKSSELSTLVDALVNISPHSTVGCLSASPSPGLISCSVALFDTKTVIPFRSTIPGQEKTQVGRWHAFRKKDERETEHLPDDVDWNNLWKPRSRADELPGQLSNAADISSVVYFSDLFPEGLSSAISDALPRATQLGLLASSTPFITGRPVTLFYNQQVYETGAVGIALRRSRSLQFRLPTDIQPLGDSLNVTHSEGNLISTLNSSNPTQLLLSRIRAAGIDTTSSSAISFKEDMQFYLGVLGSNHSSLDQLHLITSGDTSRGTIALNTQTTAPPVGSRVRFFHRRRSSSDPMPMSLPMDRDRIIFTALPPDETKQNGFSLEVELDNQFLAASENGFVLGRPGESPWLCNVPGCISLL